MLGGNYGGPCAIRGGGTRVGIGTDPSLGQLHVFSNDPTVDGVYSLIIPVGGGAAIAGVHGISNAPNGNGVIGEANNGSGAFGVWGKSTSGEAGHFSGIVGITTLSKSLDFLIAAPHTPALIQTLVKSWRLSFHFPNPWTLGPRKMESF